MSITRIAAAALLASVAQASTWTVDAGGGGQFGDIQSAILASQPGDVVLVQPGNYAPFTLDRGLTIIGYGTPIVVGPITIAGLPTPETAALVGIEPTELRIRLCRGAVIVQDLHQLTSITVERCRDVRLTSIGIPPHSTATPTAGLRMQLARLEVADCDLRGADAAPCTSYQLDGGNGVTCGQGRLHSTRSMLRGGRGSSCSQQGYYAGDGGIGLHADFNSQVILAGDPSFRVEGGAQGTNPGTGNCFQYGFSGVGLLMETSSAVRKSGVLLDSPLFQFGQFCSPYPGTPLQNLGGAYTLPTPDDPSLTSSGSVVPGGLVQFLLEGSSGASAVLAFGRTAILVPEPGIVIERLTPNTRVVSLGTLPAGGTATFDWHVPASWSPGTMLFAQAELTLPGGEIRRTNSVPLIVR